MLKSETFPLVKGLINEFESKGFEVEKANYGGYSKPDVVKKFRPDVIGWNNEKKLFYLGDVLTKSTLQNKETMDKLLEHSNLTMNKGPSEGKKIPLFLGVPNNNSSKMIQQMDEIGIPRSNIYTLEV